MASVLRTMMPRRQSETPSTSSTTASEGRSQEPKKEKDNSGGLGTALNSNTSHSYDKLSMPCDLYGLFVIEPLQLNVKVDGPIIFFLEMVRTFFFLVVNFGIQLLFVSRIHKINQENEGAQCRSQKPYLQLVCVFVFATSIFKEVRDCMDFLDLLLRCPVKENNGYINMGVGGGGCDGSRHGVVLHDDRDHCGSFKERWFRFSRLVKGHKDHSWSLAGMTHMWKLVCILLVAVPRLILGLVLLKVASGFIVRSSEEKMVTDTVAALFISDIGTFMFYAFTTNSVKDNLSRMPPLELPSTNCARLVSFLLVNFLLPVITAGLSVAIVWYLRRQCTGGADFFGSMSGSGWSASDVLAMFTS